MLDHAFAYDYKLMQPLHKHKSIKTLCDLLYIERKELYSVNRLTQQKLFAGHSQAELLKFYHNLGGGRGLFDVNSPKENVRLKCVELAIGYPVTECNGFEVDLQAFWIEKQIRDGGSVAGYKYEKGSTIPKNYAS